MRTISASNFTGTFFWYCAVTSLNCQHQTKARVSSTDPVIPAQAGIDGSMVPNRDSRLRGNDDQTMGIFPSVRCFMERKHTQWPD
jgi:hypothetical protein